MSYGNASATYPGAGQTYRVTCALPRIMENGSVPLDIHASTDFSR